MTTATIRRHGGVALAAAVIALGLGALFTAQALAGLPEGAEPRLARRFAQQTIPWLTWAALLPALHAIAERLALEVRPRGSAALLHLALASVFVPVQIALAGAIEWRLGLLWPELGLSATLRRLFLFRLPTDLVVYGIVAAAYHVEAYVRRLARAQATIRALNRQRVDALRSLAGGVAHELNGLLTAMLGHFELLAPSVRSPEDAAEVASIRHLLDRSTRLARQLQWMGRGAPLERVSFAPRELAERVLGDVAGLTSAPVALEAANGAGPGVATGDPDRLREMIAGIVLLLDGRASGDAPTRVAIDRTLEPPEIARRNGRSVAPRAYCRIALHNPTAALGDEAIRGLLEPELQETNGRMGLELTLAAARGLLAQMDGMLSIDAIGPGTTVIIYLPEPGPSASSALPAGV